MAEITIRHCRGSDETALLKLWNLALIHDPIDEPTFRTRVLLDINFRPEGLLLAVLDGWQADIYLDASDVWDDYLKVLESHELMRGGISSFRYMDYYDALGTVRGCQTGFRKAIALMTPGARVRRMAYLPGLEPEQDDSPVAVVERR